MVEGMDGVSGERCAKCQCKCSRQHQTRQDYHDSTNWLTESSEWLSSSLGTAVKYCAKTDPGKLVAFSSTPRRHSVAMGTATNSILVMVASIMVLFAGRGTPLLSQRWAGKSGKGTAEGVRWRAEYSQPHT